MTGPSFADVVIIGGGCYGSFYTTQLETARERGRVDYRRLLVVDQDPGCTVFNQAPGRSRIHVESDWSQFLDDFLSDPPPDSLVVPSPLMPHLLFEWLQRRVRDALPGRTVETGPLPPLFTPYETAAPDGTRYVSYADWLCPTHCIEPATCPVTRGPRTWDMSDAADNLSRANEDLTDPVLFECRHVVFGVGAIPVVQIMAARRSVLEAGGAGPASIPVATVSGCHGAFTLMKIG